MKLKEFWKSFGQGLSAWAWIVLVLLLSWAVYAAWDYSTTVNTGDSLTAEKWNSVKDKVVSNDSSITANAWSISTNAAATVPTGAIMPFNLASCPTGWSVADGTGWNPDLRWEFVRWLDNGRWVDSGRVLASAQLDAFQNITGSLYATYAVVRTSVTWVFAGSSISWWPTMSSPSFPWSASSSPLIFDASNSPWARTSTETRGRNVAFLYCIKD